MENLKLIEKFIKYYKNKKIIPLGKKQNGKTLYRFNRMQNKLFIDLDWRSDVKIGDFIIGRNFFLVHAQLAVQNISW